MGILRNFSAVNRFQGFIIEASVAVGVVVGVVSGIAALSAPAAAYEAGDWIVRGGATLIDPDASSSTVLLDGADAFGAAKLDVEDNTQLGLTATYMYTPRLGVELLASTPFKHTVVGDAGALQGADIADARHLPPTLSAVYYFSDDSNFLPYVGFGINYTKFFDEQARGPVSGGDVKLDSSFGVALQLGLDYSINENWLVNTSLRWIDIDTDATIDISGLGRVTADVEIDPYIYSVMLGYRF